MVDDAPSTVTWDAPASDALPRTDAGAERYELQEELGRGGMAVVHAAFDRQLGRRVALKLLRPDRVAEGGRARLVREAQALAQLRHPNVVMVFDVGERAGQVFLAMELVEGPPLRRWLAAPLRSPRELARVFAAAGRGLAAAHAVGLIHRDFKPDNVLVEADGTPRVADFGLARAAEAEAEPPAPSDAAPAPQLGAVTRSGSLVGTPAYLAPEVIDGAPGDERSDQFAFAVSLAEALDGARPFAGASLAELRAAMERGPRLGANAPAWLAAIVLRGLARDPAARFPSMTELVAALERDPSRRRRRIALAAGAVAAGAAAAAAIALAWPHAAAEAPCIDEPSAFAGAWDAPRRAALAATLAASHAPYAPAVARDLERALDAYAAQYVAGRRAACEAVAHRTETPAVSHLRAACLARRRAELATLVDDLARADDAMLARAPFAAAQLGSLPECADAAALLRPDSAPADPFAAGIAAAILADVDRGRQLVRLGKSRVARPRLAAAAARATAFGHRPTQAEALLGLGVAEEDTDSLADGERDERAALLAAQTSHDDAVVARAAIALALNVGRRQERYAEGRAWADLAIATSARLGRPADVDSAAHYAAGVVASAMHDLEPAQRELETALADGGDFPDTRRAELINSLGGIALRRGQWIAARDAYAQARALATPHVGEAHPAVASYTANLASVALALGDPAQAIELRRAALAIRARTGTADDARAGNDHVALAFALDAAGQSADAIREVRLGADLLAAHGAPPAAARAQIYLAQILFGAGQFDDARAAAERIEAALAAVGPPAKHDRAAALELLAEIAEARGKRGDAARLLDQARAIADEPMPGAPPGSASDELGSILRLQARLARLGGDARAALALAQRARTLLLPTDGPGSGTVALAALEEGLAHAALHDRAAADAALRDAAAVLRASPRWAAAAAECGAAMSPTR